jgi:tetratricopeptide (TPR) repeat protein
MAVHREQVLQSAEKLLSRGKLDQALKEYLRVLEEHPKDIPTLNKVGDLYVRMNRPGESIPYFERIADFYSKDGFFLKAIAIYKKINKIDPARLEVYDRLADLYHKQGLVQDARSQYQVLADHYQKNNRIADAIGVYKKMAGIDPADLRIQVRLADLYRSANQKDQAVMQYGLIGSMLLKRGAHDEAAQVFQKALELSPDDVETQRNLVRSLLAQKNAAAAMAVLRAAPRTGESLGLMAEAQLELGDRAEAVRTAEQALALDADAETPRLFLARLRVQEHAFDRALEALSPLVLTAVARREFAKASEYLEPLLAADPGHTGALEKLAHVLEAEGNRPALAKVHVQLGQAIESRSPAEARDHFLRAQEADPSNIEAARRLQEIGAAPAAAAPAPAPIEEPPEYQELVLDLEDSASIHAPQPKVPSIEVDEEFTAAPAPAAVPSPAAPAPPAAARESMDDAQVETLIVEAEVFARYGLADKAIERLFALVRRRPDLLKARERLVELLAETRNPALPREAESLAAAFQEAGRVRPRPRRVLPSPRRSRLPRWRSSSRSSISVSPPRRRPRRPPAGRLSSMRSTSRRGRRGRRR